MWTRRGKYGLKALLHLANLREGEIAQIAAIARAEDIPRKFLENILIDLKHGQFVTSQKGKGGGYRLARPAHCVTVGEVVRLLEGPIAPLACASRTHYRRCEDCLDESSCCIRLMTIEVRDAIVSVLDDLSLEAMRDHAAIEANISIYHI